MSEPLIVGIGGTPSASSSSEAALRLALDSAERLGARTMLFDGPRLAQLPLYLTRPVQEVPMAGELVDAVRKADGVIIASPGYHGSISGLVKNALDYLEETARDERPYLSGLPVGLIVTAYGWQATGSTLAALRSIVHALRGWPTPFGVTINSAQSRFSDGTCSDPTTVRQIGLSAEQVLAFARAHEAGTLIGSAMPA